MPPGYGEFTMPPVTLDGLLRFEATHCARCHRPASTLVRQPGIAGQRYCEECDQAVQAQRCIGRVREECGASDATSAHH
jgi:hypothetical protein